MKGAGWTKINGTMTKLDVAMLVTGTTANGIAVHLFTKNGKKKVTIGSARFYNIDKKPPENSNGCFATVKLYFYVSGTGYRTALTVNGTGQFNDIDQYEGIAFT